MCQSLEEAERWMEANGGEWVQERPGEDKVRYEAHSGNSQKEVEQLTNEMAFPPKR